jgi:hypothetical protein
VVPLEQSQDRSPGLAMGFLRAASAPFNPSGEITAP